MTKVPLTAAHKALDKLGEVLPRKGRVLIIPHDYPDPDALASAAGMELLLSRYFKLKGQIVFTGEVSRAENRELLRQLKYRWKFLGTLREPKAKVPAIFVDTSPWSRNVTVPSFIKPVAVVDHHPVRKKGAPEGMFQDIRSGHGASAGIVAEYLLAAELPIPRWLCTLLAYAMATETLDLSRGSTSRDLEMYSYLLARSNLGMMGKIRHAPLPRAYYSYLGIAMRHARTYGRVAWTHLDSVSEPEIVAELAELLLRMERITWAFCTGFHGDRLLLSLRSSSREARCGRLIRRLTRRGGAGGGHHQMAAGYLDLTGVPPEDRGDYRDDLIRALVEHLEPRLKQSDEPLGMLAQPLSDPNG